MKRTIFASLLVATFFSGMFLPGFVSAQSSNSNYINEPSLISESEKDNKKLQAQIEILFAQIKRLSEQVGINTTYNLPTATKKDAFVWRKEGKEVPTRNHVISELSARIANKENQSVAVEWKTKTTTDAELVAFCSRQTNIFNKEDGKTYVCPSSGTVVLVTYKKQKNNSASFIPESLQYGNQISFTLYTSRNKKPTDKMGVGIAFDSQGKETSGVDPAKIEIVGEEDTYESGETINFSVKGTTKDGNIADPSNGLHDSPEWQAELAAKEKRCE